MSKRAEVLKKDLNDSRAYLTSVLDAVGDRWETQVYSDGAQWTVKQVLIHLAISDAGMVNNMKGIVEGREMVPPDFEIDRYNKRSVEKRAEMTVHEARTALEESRRGCLEWLDSLDDSSLDKQGRHPLLQILSIAQFLKIMARHERGHAEDVAKALGIEA